MKYVLDGPQKRMLILSNEQNPTAYFSEIGKYVLQMKEKGKGVIFLADTFLYAAFGDGQFNLDEFTKVITEGEVPLKVNKQNKVSLKEGKV